MANEIQNPYPFFTDKAGNALEAGKIYIGIENENPETNPQEVFWDEELTIPAAQPIRTSGGYPVYNGTPSNFYAAANYSIRVRTKANELVYSSLDESSSGGLLSVDSIADLKDLSSGSLTDGQTVYVTGYASPNDGGQGMFRWDEASVETDNGGTIISLNDSPGTGRMERMFIEYKPEMFGAFPDGNDVSATMQSMLTLAQTDKKSIQLGFGTYNMAAGTWIFTGPIVVYGLGNQNTKLAWTKTSGNAIEIGGFNAGFFGLRLRDFAIEGPSNANTPTPTQSTVGIQINPPGTSSPNTTNGVFEAIDISQFFIGIQTTRSWNWSMKDCLVRLCSTCLDFNIIDTVLLSRCSFNTSRIFVDATTGGGLQFDDCNFNNSSLTASEGYCIDIYQALAQFNNCYFENVSADGAIGVGHGAVEAPESRSCVIVQGGEKNGTESFIVLGDTRIGVSVDKVRTENGDLFIHPTGFDTSTPGTPQYLVNPLLTVIGETEVAAVGAMRGALTSDNLAEPIREGGGGASLVTNPSGDGYMILSLTGAANRGPVIAENLVVDQWYTLAIAARKSSEYTTAINLVNEDGGSGSIIWNKGITVFFADTLDDEFEWRYMSFKASADRLWIQLTDIDKEMHIKGALVLPGVNFNIPEISDRPTAVYGYTEPDNGFFYDGQTVFDKSPVAAAPMGWACTNTGWANATAWTGSTAYNVDDRVNNGGNVYICRVAGTSDGAGGPAGTGAGITDGSVTWDYVAELATFVTMPNYV